MNKKHLFLVAVVMALVLCMSFGVCAHEFGTVTASGADDPNQYTVDAQISAGYANGDIWIGTLSAWDGALGSTNTFFDNGEAIHPDDIILTNGKVGIVLAVGTRNPWGYPAGSVLDAGTVTGSGVDDYVGGRDNTWSIEPLVNGWDAWAPDNCGVVSFELIKYDFAACEESETGIDAVKVSRIYLIGSRSFDVVSYYGLDAGADFAYAYNYYKNTGAAKECSVRFSVTNKGDDAGAMFQNKINASVGSYTAANGQEYSVALMMPGVVETSVGKVTVGKWGGSVGYKELRIDGVEEDGTNDGNGKYSFSEGEEVTFPCAIVISDVADMTAANEYYLDYMGFDEVTNVFGETVANGTVIVKENGKDYGWFKADGYGKFSFNVPQRNDKTYTMYLESNGYCDSEEVEIGNMNDYFNAGELVPGAEKVDVTIFVEDQDGNPLPAKVEVFEPDGDGGWVSSYPTVRFNGDSVYYADDADSTGVINIEVEPGEFKAVVYGQGYWFTSKAVAKELDTADGDVFTVTVEEELALPENWYSGDMHHHANKNDAFSAPQDVVKSMQASGIDIYLTTDHDFTTNNAIAYNLSEEYDLLGYLPSEEISCSWAHFNVVPLTWKGYYYFLDQGQDNNVMNQFAHLDFFVNQTHEHGATITANHPWYSYGLFYAYYQDAIPGGYVDDYDTVEINATCTPTENSATVKSVTDLWTAYVDETQIYQDIAGEDVYTDKPHYLVGGSDTHDVRYPGFANDDYTNSRSGGWYATGKARSIAYSEDIYNSEYYQEDNALTFAEAIAAGRSYMTLGPILDLSVIPGDEPQFVKAGDSFEVDVDFASVNDISNIYVLTKNGAEPLIEGDFIEVNYVDDLYADVENAAVLYDKEATDAARATITEEDGIYSATVSVDVKAPVDNNWVAIVVIDKKGDWAMTNPYWIVAMPNDVQANKWYYQAVQVARYFDIVNGHVEGDFAPTDNVTRAEFCKMCYEALSNHRVMAKLAENYTMPERKAGPASFPDVEQGKWYTEAVTWMASKGYINGYDNGLFGTNDLITRAQICKILDNIVGEPITLKTEQVTFADIVGTEWYAKSVMNLASFGVVNGVGSGFFAPNNNATRAEAIKMIVSLIIPFLDEPYYDRPVIPAMSEGGEHIW